MFARFQPCDDSSNEPRRSGSELRIPFCDRPLRLVTISDRAMEPEIYPGQQAFIQNFQVGGANYMEQRMAFRYEGKAIVRYCACRSGGYKLFGRQDGYEIMLDWSEGWKPPEDWRNTGVIHPDCTALGPLLTGRHRDRSGGWSTFLATSGWSN